VSAEVSMRKCRTRDIPVTYTKRVGHLKMRKCNNLVTLFVLTLHLIGSDDASSGGEFSESSPSGGDVPLSDMELCSEGEVVEG